MVGVLVVGDWGAGVAWGSQVPNVVLLLYPKSPFPDAAIVPSYVTV